MVAGLVAVIAGATPAALGSTVLPAGDYGGGAAVAPPRPIYAAGSMLLGLRATAAGAVRISATVMTSCSEDATFAARATAAPGGAFSASGAALRRIRGAVVRTRYAIAGAFSGASASGTATARSTITRGGRSTRCPSSTVRWSARRPAGDLGGPGPAPRAHLFGTTSQRLGGPRGAIVLRVSSDATRLERALYGVSARCGGGSREHDHDAPRRNLRIGARGEVRDVERFESSNRRTTVRSTERFAGTIGAAGATGTFSTSTRVVDRRTGRTLARCGSGTVRWTAAV